MSLTVADLSLTAHGFAVPQIWQSGFSISYSKAVDALNGDKINSTMYYVLSNVPAPLHDPNTKKETVLELSKTLHYPDKCYNGHTALYV